MVCPVTMRTPWHFGEVSIPTGDDEQTRDGLVLVSQLRTMISAHLKVGGEREFVVDLNLHGAIRRALAAPPRARPSAADGAA
jgi:hypothetical protein